MPYPINTIQSNPFFHLTAPASETSANWHGCYRPISQIHNQQYTKCTAPVIPNYHPGCDSQWPHHISSNNHDKTWGFIVITNIPVLISGCQWHWLTGYHNWQQFALSNSFQQLSVVWSMGWPNLHQNLQHSPMVLNNRFITLPPSSKHIPSAYAPSSFPQLPEVIMPPSATPTSRLHMLYPMMQPTIVMPIITTPLNTTLDKMQYPPILPYLVAHQNH